MNKSILITGGTGYIGSHAAVELINQGYTVTIIDNLANSSEVVIDKIEQITNKRPSFFKVDLCNFDSLNQILKANSFDAVIHFSGLKAVGESVKKPLEYYENNLISTISLLKSMKLNDVNKLVFSSSATVYGNPGVTKYSESLPTGQGITNPYGQTKFMIEQIIKDFSVANPNFEASLLRYFNPIGAHPSGLIGENPKGVPNNLMPFIVQVASGQREKLSIFGNDYPTPDGTCLRDYIHVVDLAKGHLAALEKLRPGISIYNLGSGKPTSVLELVHNFIKTTGVNITYEFSPRRDGDLPEFYADPTKAKAELGWQTELSIEEMCRDSWNWQSQDLARRS